MADVTKIVPTLITSNLTVSEVNGISLTKAKKTDESSLPTTSFAQILEAQLSQEQVPSNEVNTESKQILPGQNVDSSLFGSLIVVVRDVEVPITEENDTQKPIETNRLFVPTIFTASTASNVSIPISKKSANEDNSLVTTNDSIKQSNLIEQATVVSSNEVASAATNFTKAFNNTTVVPKVESLESDKSELKIKVDKEVEPSTTPIASVFKDITVVATPPAPTSVNTASKNIKKETTVSEVSTATVATQNTSSTRSLSSMLQSVQGLKMGFERSANQQTFITVALPISEVERLVVANPEVFATLGNSSTSNNETSTDVETNDFANDKIVSPTVNTVSTNLQVDNEFIPTSFETIADSNNQATRNSSQTTNSFTPVVQAKDTSNTIPTIVENAKPNITEGTETIENSTASARIATLASKIETFATNLQSISSPTSNVTVSTNETETKTTSTTGKEFTYKATVETVSEKRTIVVEPVEKENPIVPTIASKKNLNEPTRSVVELLQNADLEGSTIESLLVKIPVQASKRPVTVDNTVSNEAEIPKSIVNVQTTEIAVKPFTNEQVTTLIEPKKQAGNKETEQVQLSTITSTKRDFTQTKDFSSVLQRVENIKQKNTTDSDVNIRTAPTSTVKTTITQIQNNIENIGSKDNTVGKVEISKTEVKSVSHNSNPVIQTNELNITDSTKIDSKVSQTKISTQSIVEPTSQNVPNNVDNTSDSLQLTSKVIQPKTLTQSNVEPLSQNAQNKVDINTDSLDVTSNVVKTKTSSQPKFETTSQNVHSNSENNAKLDLSETNVSQKKSESTSTIESKLPNLQNREDNIVGLEKSTLSTVKIQKDASESNISETSNDDGETKENIISLANTVTTPIKSTEQIVIPTSTTEQLKQVTVEELPQAIVKEFVSEKTTTGSRATFSLNPEQLGTVNVKIDLQGNNASITLESSQKETIPMLEKQLDILKEQLKSSNIFVDKLDILFKPTEVIQTSPTPSDTFTNSQHMEQQEIDRRQQNKQQHSHPSEIENVDDIQPKRFGDGSSIIEEYI